MSHKHLTISSDTGQLKVVRDAVIELASPCLPDKAHMLALAVDEAVANVILHGGWPQKSKHATNGASTVDSETGSGQPADPRDTIDVRIDSDTHRLQVLIADSGPAYNPVAAVTVDAPERVLARKRNGMGLSIMRRVMDEIHYDRTADARNELRLIKYIRSEPDGNGKAAE